ncbi:MAG TPA: hypothetical protein VGA08_01785 [Candidatus Saccharimonadales bacterium]
MNYSAAHITGSIKTSNTSYSWLVRVIITSIFTLLCLLSWSQVSRAAFISEGFLNTGNLAEGMLVSVNQEDPANIALANLTNNQYLTGVVSNSGDSLINVNYAQADIQVAIAGEVAAYVSDLNGDIKAGDFVGTSWLSGVGMKANEEDKQKLLGIALEDFNQESIAQDIEDVPTPSGEKTARVGLIKIRLFDREAGPNPTGGLSGIEILASKIAGKTVPFARVLVASGLFALSVIISGVFLANAIRGSFISLGRNPLASGSIFTSLLQVSGVSVSLVLIGSVIAYILLVV